MSDVLRNSPQLGMNKKEERVEEAGIAVCAGMDDDVFYWSKNSGPSPDKDHTRNAIAELCLSPFKIKGSVLKSVHLPETSEEPRKKEDDLAPFLCYSLNKKRRWETEEELGVELLDRVSKLNDGWKVLILERVHVRSYMYNWIDFTNGMAPERFLDDYKIRCVHQFEQDGGYEKNELRSTFGQRFSHFLKSNRLANKKDDHHNQDALQDEPVVAYNFVRAPKNIVTLLQKRYISSNYGWDWPHSSYWRRIDRLKALHLELRYGELEHLDEHVDIDSEQDSVAQNAPAQFYNLEDHIVDNDFVMVKNKKKKDKKKSL